MLPESPNVPSGSGPSPLADPAHWDRLIEAVRPDRFLVVIASSMSESMREHCSPEDIWQETLARAWAAREQHRWEGHAAFRAWLLEIARNRIIDTARRLQSEKRGEGRSLARISEIGSDPSGRAPRHVPVDSTTPSRIAMLAERAEAIQRALATLPPELEPVVRMHLLEELPMEAIARRLGIGVSAAWRRFRKGVELYSRHIGQVSGRPGSSF